MAFISDRIYINRPNSTQENFRLDVSGNLNVDGEFYKNGSIFQPGGSGNVNWASGNVGSNNQILTSAGDGSIVSEANLSFTGTNLSLDGSFGIGTSNPSCNLHISGYNRRFVINPPNGIFGKSGINLITESEVESPSRIEIYETSTNYLEFIASADQYNQIRSNGKQLLLICNPNGGLNISPGLSIGSNYIGNNIPSNGLIVEGSVGFGTTSIGSSRLNVSGNIYNTGNIRCDGSIGAGGNIDASGNITYRIQRIPITTATNLTASHNGTIIECSSTNNFNFTLNQQFDGFNCTIVNINTGDVTLAAGSGVTIRHETANRKLTTQWRGVSLYFRSATEVVILGSLES